jgi:hypothetical protein
MIDVLALVAAIRDVNPALTPDTAKDYAAWVVEASQQSDIDPWVFHAIIKHETKWTASGIRHENDGSCSIGLGQINVGNCRSSKVKTLLDPHYNLLLMGEFLYYVKGFCRRNCSKLNWLRAYNPGDPRYVSMVESHIRYCKSTYTSKQAVNPEACSSTCSAQVYDEKQCLNVLLRSTI